MFSEPKSIMRNSKEQRQFIEAWGLPRPADEARALVGMIGRNGDNVETMRALISISEEERREMAEWAQNPTGDGVAH